MGRSYFLPVKEKKVVASYMLSAAEMIDLLQEHAHSMSTEQKLPLTPSLSHCT